MGRVMIIGATGTIGSAIVELLEEQHELIAVGHTSGEHRVDLASKDSIAALFADVGQVDAIVCAAGEAPFGTLDTLSDDDFSRGIGNKLMGQVNLVRLGRSHVNKGGSITLTSGVLGRKPAVDGVALGLVNGALDAFVRAAALSSADVRINVVSPGWVKETLVARGENPGSGVAAARVAFAYRAAIDSTQTGQTLDTRDY